MTDNKEVKKLTAASTNQLFKKMLMEIKVSEKPVGNGTKNLAVPNKGVSCPSSGGEEKSSFSSLLCQGRVLAWYCMVAISLKMFFACFH